MHKVFCVFYPQKYQKNPWMQMHTRSPYYNPEMMEGPNRMVDDWSNSRCQLWKQMFFISFFACKLDDGICTGWNYSSHTSWFLIKYGVSKQSLYDMYNDPILKAS